MWQLIFDKGAETVQEETRLFNKWYWRSLCKKIYPASYLTPFTKQLKVGHRPTDKYKSIEFKLLEIQEVKSNYT